MHILFVHQNFPAQFGLIASHLVKKHGFRCSFVSELPPGHFHGIERIQYRIQGGATEKTHYCSRTFENAVWHSHAVYEALRPPRHQARPGRRAFRLPFHRLPARAVQLPGHQLLRVLLSHGEFGHGFPPGLSGARDQPAAGAARNANLLLDLENCDAGYSPTEWQRSRLPSIFQ